MKKQLYVCMVCIGSLIFGGTAPAWAQNLVINHGFENHTGCFGGISNFSLVNDWSNSNEGSPDFYHPCNGYIMGVPANNGGFQYAYEGEAYAGIVLACDNNEDYREGIQGRLTTPLEADKYYCVEMYIALGQIYNYYCNTMGVYFSNGAVIPIPNVKNNLDLSPQVNYTIAGITDTVNWHKISGQFKATGGETNFIITNFDKNPVFTSYWSGGWFSYTAAYYFIDSVNIYECEQWLIEIPNVITPNNDGVNDAFFIKNLPPQSAISIYNRWGVEIFDSKNYNNNWSGPGNTALADGIYYYLLRTPDQTIHQGFFHVFNSQ